MTSHIFHLQDDLARQRMLRQISQAPLVDERGRGLMVTVQRVQAKTRIPQKGLFYIWASAIADHVGETAKQTAEDLKHALLPTVETVNRFTGEFSYVRQSTEDLDEAGWNLLLTRVEELASTTLGLQLPRRESDEACARFRHYQAAMAAGEVR